MNGAAPDRRPMAGFSLIELMIVLAILAIIAAIAIPSYERSVMRSDRSDAMTALTQDAQTLERCYTQYFSYTPAAPATCPALIGGTQNGYYTITTPTLTPTAYTLEATAVAGPPANDTDCHRFAIDSVGNKLAYTAANVTSTSIDAECWGD